MDPQKDYVIQNSVVNLFVSVQIHLSVNYPERNYAQTQFSVIEFRVQGQSSDFQCMHTTHYNAYSPEKGHYNVYSPK